MIIWINGAFGSGKTTCTYELNKRLSNSFVYDPENIGYFIRKNIPKELYESDFQNHDQWRVFNYEMLKYLNSTYEGIILVPMTLVNRQYYDEIIGRLIKENIKVKHYILYAEKKTIEKRLNKRFEWSNSWAKSQIDRCIYAFNHHITEEKIITDHKTIDDIVEEIAEKSGLTLRSDKRGHFKKLMDRWATLIKHIR
ncbi:DEAD/DEAH box helicase family protein [Alkaliphilus oremlandii]|uniref:ATP-binding membrane protein n=1 Tax=Alkaliphilus oremlandii (strain OhILAs) TaxID=350688 RepID=A8MLZ4_ALKOO|nr:AAA family ATPase [Alkaliphilus oremlandii]ABW18161.1 ATP-binding membrane protein [Alkaliphilus oremlandii OhILAs]